VLFCLRPEDITLSNSSVTSISSARNHVNGRITRMTPSGPLVRVVIDCGLPVVALITRGSANDMKLEEGQPVTATFKATAVHLIPR
jgi:molybdopterin-binding protein